MPAFWENFSFTRPQNHHNLQDGLFQIASQTCSILVKVNNTNNICYGNPLNGAYYDLGAGGEEPQPAEPLVPSTNLPKKSSIFGYRQRLSTVLESANFGNAAGLDDDFDQWEQSFMLRQDQGPASLKKWGTDSWCRPSCIPISFILILIILVVLVPLLDHSNSFANTISKANLPPSCPERCKITLVETIPEGLILPPDSQHLSTQKSWLDLIDAARSTIEIASFYWTLRFNEIYPHNSSMKGEEVFQALYGAGTKDGIDVNIVQSFPTKDNPNTDTEYLVKKKAANVRSVNFPKLLGGGVLHTKFWLIDRKHFYLGSANMDWRSLTQVKELGIVGYNCSCIANDMAKIFEVYWMLGADGATIPDKWPPQLRTMYNLANPMNVSLNGQNYLSYISSSPPPLSTTGRTDDIDAITNAIQTADSFVYIAVMDYFPLMIYTPKVKFWPVIDDAIRKAAIDDKVNVRMLISWWNHSRPAEDYFLRSLTSLTRSYKGINIEVKRYVVPATQEELKIPFARVNHNKYMVTDKVGYIGTSNWSGDYFVNTAGVGLIVEEPEHSNGTSVRKELQDIFERDWSSPYAVPLIQ